MGLFNFSGSKPSSAPSAYPVVLDYSSPSVTVTDLADYTFTDTSTYCDSTFVLKESEYPEKKKEKLDLSNVDYDSMSHIELVKYLHKLRKTSLSLEQQLYDAKVERLSNTKMEDRKFNRPQWFQATSALSKRISDAINDVEVRLGIENRYVKFYNLAKQQLSPEIFSAIEVQSDKRLQK